jgi:ribonuclease HI
MHGLGLEKRRGVMAHVRVFVDASPTFACLVIERDGELQPPLITGLLNLTNNEAEYEAIRWALEREPNVEEVLTENLIAVRQLNHEYHIREPRLRERAMAIWKLSAGVKFTWIPKGENPAGKALG